VQIVLNHTGGGSTTLCHGHARVLGQAQGPIGRLEIDGGYQVQTRLPIRKTHARPIGRGGKVETISFSTETEYATNALAEAAISAFLNSNTAGTLVITYDGGGTRSFADAALQSYSLVQIGVTLQIRYTFIAGVSS
jgi:hypothetical protein